MPRKNWKSVSTDQILLRLKQAGLNESSIPVQAKAESSDMENLSTRIQHLLGLYNNIYRKPTDMIYLVMYDIESDKVRNLVAKYLISQGCIRIQNSIFIADTSPERCESIKRDLTDVQAAYDNNDSILVVPLSSSNFEAMHIIGRQLDLQLIMKNTSTIFF